MAQNWDIDPKTGDYIMAGGAPSQTDSLRIPAYIRTKAPRTQWMYAPDTNWGSDFYQVRKNRSSQDPSIVENIQARALQPIADDGRASQINISTTSTTRNSVQLETQIIDNRGQLDTLVLVPVGV